MNIEELQAVSKIIAELTGSAYDGFILWMIYMFVDVLVGYVLGGLAIYLVYRLIQLALSLIKIGSAFKNIANLIDADYYGDPTATEITRVEEKVRKLVKENNK